MDSSAYQNEHFINREQSWLEFNARVLEEALDQRNPLIERAKFLAIFSSNLDEFFMVRVAGLREQAFGDGAPQDVPPDGQRAVEQLAKIANRTQQLVADHSNCWSDLVQPALADTGIRVLRYSDLTESQRTKLDDFFWQHAFPVLTPMAIDPAHPTPRFHNRGLYLAVTLDRTSGLGPSQLFAVVQVPQVLPRFVPIGEGGEHEFILLENVIAARLPELFGGFEILNWTTFRITRDMDLDLLDQEGDDLLRLIEERLRMRQRSVAVRLEISDSASDELIEMLIREEDLHVSKKNGRESYSEVYRIHAPLDLTCLWELTKLKVDASLKEKPLSPRPPVGLPARATDIFEAIDTKDILLHHPYESFDPVVDFVQRAAQDPKVLAIKQTLYRTSGDSPIVQALIDAAENGKQVTALVELKARFDEQNNVTWARRMESAGVHVVYGFLDLKTHCKVLLVVRQEGAQVKQYVHLGTGNYNPITAQLYTDMGLFTSDEAITNDATALFNLLTGYSQGHEWKKLVVAPNDLRRRTIELIDQQTARAQNGQEAYVFAKLNSLVDRRTIEALYRASQAGVKIDLVVRGVCGLRPGMPGISENIHVRSIVGRFLEHSRVYIFGPRAQCEVYLSSADWMPRNFIRRVEVMFPIEDEDLRSRILDELLPTYLRDNCSARILNADGTYHRLYPQEGDPVHRCQDEMIAMRPQQDLAEARLPEVASPESAKPNTDLPAVTTDN